MNKKLGLLVATGALVGTIGVGSTLAWFTDTKTATNNFTMGKVEIDLTENDKEVPPSGGLTFENVVPGDDLAKKVEVQSKGTVDSYLRCQIKFVDNQTGKSEADLIKMLDIQKDWEKVGDYYYYKGIVKPGEPEKMLFSKVNIPSDWTSDVASKGFKIEIKSEGIQAKNLYDSSKGFSATDLAAAWK